MAFDLAKTAYGKESVSKLDKMKLIPLDDIQKNSRNFYSMDGIAELAGSIEMVGLLNPVSVIADGGKYRLVSGHRRLVAYEKLYMDAERGSEKFHEYSRIPAIVLRDMDDLKETLALITANSTARELSYDEKLKQEQMLRETLQAMKAAGMEVPKNLGQYIADQIGVSRNEVSRMHSVNENLIPEAREKVAAGELNANQAYELSRKPKEEQESSLSKSLEEIDAIATYSKVKKVMPAILRAMHGGYHTRTDVLNDLKDIGRGWWSCSTAYAFVTSYADRIRIDGTEIKWAYFLDCLVAAIFNEAVNAPYRSAPQGDAASVHDRVWMKGTPPNDGEYVCKMRPYQGAVAIRKVLYWQYDSWRFARSGSPVSDSVDIIAWFPMPPDDTEEV